MGPGVQVLRQMPGLLWPRSSLTPPGAGAGGMAPGSGFLSCAPPAGPCKTWGPLALRTVTAALCAARQEGGASCSSPGFQGLWVRDILLNEGYWGWEAPFPEEFWVLGRGAPCLELLQNKDPLQEFNASQAAVRKLGRVWGGLRRGALKPGKGDPSAYDREGVGHEAGGGGGGA